MINKTPGRIPFPPFSFSTIVEGAKRICELLYSQIIGGDYISYEQFEVYDTGLSALTVPESAVYALIICEANVATSNLGRAIRFSQDGEEVPPNAVSGMPLGDNGCVDIAGSKNLKSIRFIGIEAGLAHTLRVEYYA